MIKRISYLVIIAALLLIPVGCRRPLQRISPPAGEDSYLQYQHDEQVKDSKMIQGLANDIVGVEDAVVVVKGDEVYIGMRDPNHNSIDQLRKKITDKVKQETKYSKIYITTEEDSVNTLERIKTEVLRGVEVEQYRQELNNIRDLIVL